MGIFNRKSGEQDRSQFEFEDSFAKPGQQPMSRAPAPPMAQRQVPVQAQAAPVANQARPKRRSNYSIEDAIVLMRELPTNQRDMVVSIVQKTLSSADISVDDILDDASRKLNRLGTRRAQLDQEIAELETGIKERQAEIEKITVDAEETEAVKISFESAIGIDSSEPMEHAEPPRQQRQSQVQANQEQQPSSTPPRPSSSAS